MIRFSRLLLPAGALLCLLSTPRAFAQTNEVLSCGDNSFVQIGDGTATDRLTLTPAYSISGIKAIACGYFHTLALDSTGTVWGWGYNGQGQLGIGDTGNRATPVPIMNGIKAIAAGRLFSLALDYGGRVWAWGDNTYGELGMGDFVNRYFPTQMTGLNTTPIKAIACGGYHSLMLDQQGNLYGCGYNYYGQLMQTDNNDRYTPTLMDQAVEAMAAGYAHTLVLVNGGVFAAGLNDHGELGDGTQTNGNNWVSFPSNHFPKIRIRSIGAGNFHSLAVAVDGSVWAWGYNGYGQLGLGDKNDRLYPTQMPRAAYAKAVTGGERHTLVLTAGGKVLATGYNSSGQLGDGTQTDRSSLTPVKNASFIGSIAAGSDYSVLFKPFTRSLATGYNNFGQLGIGSTVNQKNQPVPMKIGSSILAVSTGPSGSHSLLLRADGTVWACGANYFGQLGNGVTTNSIAPVEVKGPGGVGYLTDIIAIAAGDYHSMALAADGSVYTWGGNGFGQLGTGYGSSTPVQVMGSDSAIAIAAGGDHSMVIGIDDSLYACGRNDSGQLGLGNTTNQSGFTTGGFAVYASGLVGGEYHSVFLDYQGELLPFGLNSNGQLGTGDTTNQDWPDFEQGTQFMTAAAGGYHTLVLNAAGLVWAAGYNGDGQLGVGNTNDQWNWTFIQYLQATGIACGYFHSLFVDVNGNLYACGYGSYGQLGTGSTANTKYPTIVPGAPYTTSMAGGFGHTLILTAPKLLLASVKVSPTSVVGGTSTTGTVTLSGLAGAGGQTVSLSCDSNLVSLPSTVTVTPTSKTASFTIKTTRVSAKTVAHIYATMGNEVSATLTITP